MAHYTIKKGLDLPLSGAPSSALGPSAPVSRVAVLAGDFHGLKPKMLVQEGESVRRGQPILEDRKRPGVLHTAPGAGTVVAVNRGDKRALQSVVVALNEREQAGEPAADDFHIFESFTALPVASLSDAQVRALLVESGLWTAFKARPFSVTPGLSDEPHAIFVNAMDSNPHAADPLLALAGRGEDFVRGLEALTRITHGTVHVCRRPGAAVPVGSVERVAVEEFSGPHPAGLPGTHIHFVDPVGRNKTVWTISAADVLSIGALFATGRLDVGRVVSLAGPAARNPRLLRTRLGASLDELTAGELVDGEVRVISGSVLGGTAARGPVLGYLGRFAAQVAVLKEGRQREFLGWLTPGFNVFSIVPTFLSKLFPGNDGQTFSLDTNVNGSIRAMVPIGLYEEVMPLDILPTHLLRSLSAGDLERAEALGALELDEEDLALCTLVCPGKSDWGPALRSALSTMESEG